MSTTWTPETVSAYDLEKNDGTLVVTVDLSHVDALRLAAAVAGVLRVRDRADYGDDSAYI